jgi:tetratricopeptide (TPR) repeat protein
MVLALALVLLQLIPAGTPLSSTDRGEAERLFALGMSLVAERDTSGAMAAFEGALATGWTSAEAEYNLGSLALHRGEKGVARLHLERAARLAPLDASVQKNLGLARSAVGVRAPGPAQRLWDVIRSTVRPLGLVGLSVSLNLLLGFILIRQKSKSWHRIVLGGAAVLVLIAATTALVQESRSAGIALVATSVRSTAGASALIEGELTEGQRVTLGDSEGDWREVKARGVRGWVPDASVQPL